MSELQLIARGGACSGHVSGTIPPASQGAPPATLPPPLGLEFRLEKAPTPELTF